MKEVYSMKSLVEGQVYDFTDSEGEVHRYRFIAIIDRADEDDQWKDEYIVLETEDGKLRAEWEPEEMQKAVLVE